MKLLLLGANGQVGHELRRALAPLGEVVCATRGGTTDDGAVCESVDLADAHGLEALVARVAPDSVVNAAAYTAVDRAEQEPAPAHAINAIAPRVIARACAARGARLVHYSTDYVFDGTGSRPYREDDPVAPLGVYGSSKAEGEAAIRASGADHLILRTAWVYGLHGHNFLRTMLRLGAEREQLRVVADQIGCPTPAWLIADVTAQLLARQEASRATFHVVCRGATSWHGFADAIFEQALAAGRLASRPRVEAIGTADYPTPARRPAYSVLDPARLEARLGQALPDWKSALGHTFRRTGGQAADAGPAAR